MVYFRRSKNEDAEEDEAIEKADPNSDSYLEDLRKDLDSLKDLHKGQKKVLTGWKNHKPDYMFVRAGRKFSKTTCNIMIAWEECLTHPKFVCYYCFPTMVAADDIVWTEKRMQYCDIFEDWMCKKYVKSVNNTTRTITFVNGSFISLKGTWHESRSRGMQPNLVIFDEVQDCCQDFMEGMDSNLLAKGGRVIMSGTPPRIRNHFHNWEDRIKNNPSGKTFHFSSYANDKLPDGKRWLDNKREELFRTGKQDTWFREYMAEDCFSSADRVLPDAKIKESEEMLREMRAFPLVERIPIMAIGNHGRYVCTLYGVMILSKKLYVFDCDLHRDMWQKSYALIFPSIQTKAESFKNECAGKLRAPIWDPSKSLTDVISGLTTCREDVKWQDRGIPLLREMMTEGKIVFSEKLAELGLECQKMLADETIKDIEREYPIICTLSMLCNEFFQREKITIQTDYRFDKYEPLRQFGLPVPPKKKFGESIYKQGN